MKPKNTKLRSSLFTLCVGVVLPSSLMAQTDVTWNDGAANDIYSDAANWDFGVPANDLTTEFAVLTGGNVDMSLGDRQVAGLKYTTTTNLNGTSVLEIGTGGITVTANSFANVNLLFNQPNTDITFAPGRLSFATGVVAGTGALTVSGPNTLFIDSTANTWAGGLTLNAGSSAAVKSNGSLGSGNVILAGGALGSNNGNVDMGTTPTVSLVGGGTLFANGGRIGTANDITGTGPLTIGAGNNDVFLDVANTFTGGMIIIGNVGAKNTGSLGEATGPIVFDGGNLRPNGNNITLANTRTVTLNSGGGTLQHAGGKFISVPATINGVGQLTISGTSSQVYLDVANTYEGGTVITGTASVKSGAVFGGTMSMDVVPVFEEDTPILIDGGTITSNNSNIALSALRTVTLSSAGGTLAVFNNNRYISVVANIGGDGQLTIAGGATLSYIYIDSNQSYTGGTLLKGAFARPKADAGFGAVAGAVTMDGGRIFPNAAGVTFDAARSFILGATGGTLIPNGTTTFNSVISGAGSVTISGTSGTLVFGGTNTYTGTTTVNGGVLAGAPIATPGAILAVDGDSIPNAGTLIINNDLGVTTSGRVQVTGTEVVAALQLNGAPQLLGTYGATGSGATNINDTFFSGTGVISVQVPVNDYATWSAIYAPADLTNTTGDNDNDGLTNQQEYAYGLSPVDGSSVNPILVQVDKTAGTFTYQRRSTTGLTYTVLTSPDLSSWTENIPTSEVITAIPSTDNESVAITLSGGPFPEKFFVRIKAD